MSAVEAYRACAEAGMTMAETARALGRNKNSVARASIRHGIWFAPGKPGPQGASEAQLRELAKEGLTTSEAATRLGVSPSAVSRAVKAYGVKLRDGRKVKTGGAKPRVSAAEWRALGRKNLSSTEAAHITGMSLSTVCAAARRHGFAWRNVQSEIMRAKNQDPEYKARQMRGIIGTRPLDRLTGKDREDYVLLTRTKKLRSHEALQVLGIEVPA